jgi:hypothetical protein
LKTFRDYTILFFAAYIIPLGFCKLADYTEVIDTDKLFRVVSVLPIINIPLGLYSFFCTVCMFIIKVFDFIYEFVY